MIPQHDYILKIEAIGLAAALSILLISMILSGGLLFWIFGR
jgi:hypothetical protein